MRTWKKVPEKAGRGATSLVRCWCECNTQTGRTAKHQNKYVFYGKNVGEQMGVWLAGGSWICLCDSRIHTWKWPGELVTIPASVAGLNKAIQETSLITIFFFFQRSVGKDRLCHSPFLQNRKSLLGFTGTCWFTEIGTFCTECFHFSRADLGSDRFLLGFWLPLLSQPLACCLAGWQQWGAWQTREFGTCVHHTLAGQTCNPFKAYDSNGTW